MRIPAGSVNNIREFIGKYFIEDAMPDEPVVNEDVRVIYYEEEGSKLGTPHVTKKILSFDIYVKESMLYNATNDRLQRRDKLIAQRLKELLLWKEHVCGLWFQYEDEYHLGARTIGYKRYHLVLSYKTTW